MAPAKFARLATAAPSSCPRASPSSGARRCTLRARWQIDIGLEPRAGLLAEIIVLDQFSRNVYRDNARAFASDALALALAQEMVAGAHDTALPVAQRAFAYLPFMHSESLAIHSQALLLFDQPGLEGNLRFERLHQDILQRFGRYPHRNAALGRRSTPEEEAFLQQP
ncbi:MAG: DUF924 family protein, partial [Giesbergeria sp.]